MNNKLDQSVCFRIMPGDVTSKDAYFLYLKHLFAYEVARQTFSSDSKLLEVGSGEGYGAKFLEEHVQSLDGYDISQPMVEHATEKYSSETVKFVKFDGGKIPQPDDTYDGVISFQVIEHVPDVTSYLREIKRLLKPGGTALITTPSRDYRLAPGQKPWNKFHIREYDAAGLLKELKVVFENAEVKGIRGIGETQEFELQRAASARRLIKMDPLGLRKLLPESIKSRITSGLATTGEKGFEQKYNLDNYEVISSNLETSLDLLGICKI